MRQIKSHKYPIVLCWIVLLFLGVPNVPVFCQQVVKNTTFMDHTKSFEERDDGLLSGMTLEEKSSQEADIGILLFEAGQSLSDTRAELLNPEIVRKVMKDGKQVYEIGQDGNPYPTEKPGRPCRTQ